MPRPPGKGRRKAEMKPIEKQQARQVCFSKRRQGLFKKASELSILCGAHVGALVFSPAGRAYSFGSPSVDAVIDRYLSGTAGPLPTPQAAAAAAEGELKLPRLWDAHIEELGLEELREYEKSLVELLGEIEARTFRALGEVDGSDGLVAIDEQPSPVEATTPESDAAADDLSSSAEASDSEQDADGNLETEKFQWLSLFPPGQQPPGFW